MKYRLHIAGPDDVLDFGDELSALRAANVINRDYLRDRAAHPESEVLCVATVNPEPDSRCYCAPTPEDSAIWLRVMRDPHARRACQKADRLDGDAMFERAARRAS